MRLLIVASLFLSVSLPAAEGVIVHAARKLRLSYAEPLPPKDFYVNLGSRDGLREGDQLQVRRRLGVPNFQSDGSVHLVTVSLGFMQIIALGETACIAREQSVAPASTLPALQYMGFMVGDEVLAKTGLPLPPELP